jgi:hypothetical protein
MADIADADLPVFPFKVNWKNGISERLEWRTDILTDLVGNEQRRGLRLTPRREFEVTLTLWDAERAFLDLWLHRMVGSEFLFPLWHDSVRAAQEAAQGQNNVWVDTEGLEFGIGSYALLRGLTAMSFERVEIAEVHADRIVTVDPLVSTWPKGTRVEPLVRGQMSDQTRTNLITSRASETQAGFETTRAQPYDAGVNTFDVYLGLPVLMQQPNRTEAMDVRHIWSFFDSDSGTGRRFRKSEVGRAMTSQKHSWFLRGRTAKSLFRSMLYRLQGSLKSVWLPTFNDDLTLAQDAGAGASSIYVNETGFAYTGGPSSGREYIAILTTEGRLYRRVIDTAAAPAGQERLVLDAALPTGLLRQSVRRISWMDTARLENDRIEFNHINAADGVSTVASIFKSFRNERVAPVVLSYDIPDDAMFDGACGSSPLTGFTLNNPSFDNGTASWSGTIVIRQETPNGQPPVAGPNIAFAGVGATLEFYQQLAVPERWHEWIDGDLANIGGFSAYHVTYVGQDDHGQLFVEFRDALGAFISRSSSAFDYSKTWTQISVPYTAVPAGTRFIRFGTRNIRTEGANNDNYWDVMTPGYLERDP